MTILRFKTISPDPVELIFCDRCYFLVSNTPHTLVSYETLLCGYVRLRDVQPVYDNHTRVGVFDTNLSFYFNLSHFFPARVNAEGIHPDAIKRMPFVKRCCSFIKYFNGTFSGNVSRAMQHTI
eukprot:sb/3475848/